MWKPLSWTAAALTAGAAFIGSKTKQTIAYENDAISLATDNARIVQGELKKAEEQLTIGKAARKKAEEDTIEIEKQTVALKSKVEEITKELSEKKSLLEEIDSRYEKAKTAVDNLGGIQQLKDQLVTLQREKASLESQVASSKAKVAAAIESKIRIDKEIETLRAKEAWQAQGIIEDSFRGRVSSVDPTWGYAVASAGSSSGVVSGATLEVRRGRTTIGQVKVTNVEIGRSIIEPISGTFAEGESLRAGDTLVVAASSSASAWRSKQAPTTVPVSTKLSAPPAQAQTAPSTPSETPPAESAPAEPAPATDPFTSPAAPTEPATPPSEPATSAESAPTESAPDNPVPAESSSPETTPSETPTPPSEENSDAATAQ